MTAQMPSFVQKGCWNWKSFEKGDYAGKTIIRVLIAGRPSFQHLMNLDWSDYGDRHDAEQLAAYLCAAANKYNDWPTV